MTSLASIEAEAARLIGHLPEPERRTLQGALEDLCAVHWHELRGREPGTPLARALWAIAPPLADLCADMYALRDARLDEALEGRKPGQAFALLVLLSIERGDGEGAHAAYEPMMLFQSGEAGARYVEGVSALLRRKLEAPRIHRHPSSPPLARALNLVAAHTGRCDGPAVLHVIGLLLASGPVDAELERLRADLAEAGVRFTSIDDGHVQFELHGHVHKPETTRQVGEMLAEIRQAWLA